MRFDVALAIHLAHMRFLNCRPGTVYIHSRNLLKLQRFLTENGHNDVTTVTPAILERFRMYLFSQRHRNKSLSINTQGNSISVVRLFFQSLVEKEYVLTNAARNLTRPRTVHRLPPRLPTVREIERLLKHVSTNTPNGFRNRTMVEILFGTGIRRRELTSLKLENYDQRHQTLFVTGKGLRDRTLPLPLRTDAVLREYILNVRPVLPDSEYLFPTLSGLPFTEVWKVIEAASRAARIRKQITPRTFRHVLATELLRNGADLRSIQEYLGHRNIETTVIYTHVLGKDLKRVHTKTHPHERRK